MLRWSFSGDHWDRPERTWYEIHGKEPQLKLDTGKWHYLILTPICRNDLRHSGRYRHNLDSHQNLRGLTVTDWWCSNWKYPKVNTKKRGHLSTVTLLYRRWLHSCSNYIFYRLERCVLSSKIAHYIYSLDGKNKYSIYFNQNCKTYCFSCSHNLLRLSKLWLSNSLCHHK